MCDIPEYIKWLARTDDCLTTADGKPDAVWEFCHQADENALSALGKHFRNH